MSIPVRVRWVNVVATVAAAAVLSLIAAPGAALAEPGDEGSNPTLAEVLETANRGYIDAKTKLDASQKRQAELAQQATDIEAKLAVKTREAQSIAATLYRTGRIGIAAVLLDNGSPDSFLEKATIVNTIAARDDRKIRELNQLRRELAEARSKIEAEITLQQQQLSEMDKRKREVERALAVAGPATGGWVYANSPVADPAPRRADGSWAPESCNNDDPTTTGCLTARTVHALAQARAAGFTRYTACYRPGGPYEHPKGRACDFSSERTSFGGVATGDDRFYGNNLAAYLVRNADRLGVLYTIWFKQIWTPAAGWHSYGGAGGDPSSDHTNHVHLSVY